MEYLTNLNRPSKEDQKAAMLSYKTLAGAIEQLHSAYPEIEIEETGEKIKVPLNALKLLAKILKETSQGRLVSIVPSATEMTTQAAADLLGCSRPHLVKLLDSGEIPFVKVGRHRRIKYEDLLGYKQKMKKGQEALLVEMMEGDEEVGLYDL